MLLKMKNCYKDLILILFGLFCIHQIQICAGARRKPYEYLNKTCAEAVQQFIRYDDPKTVDPYINFDQMVDCPMAMMLQKYAILSRENSGGRRKKRMLLNVNLDSSWKWPDEIIHYRMDVIYDQVNRKKVRQAMDNIENETCFQFIEVSDNYSLNHLYFQRQDSCISFVGRTQTIPQLVYLDATCLSSVGEIMHYIMHSIGMWHTHQRDDRDNYITTLPDNTQPDSSDKIDIIPPFFTITFATEYDYTSLMHYNTLANSIDGTSPTIETKDSCFHKTIGQRAEMSFYDKYLLNKAFCEGRCAQADPIDCKNGGYQDPNSCDRCKCIDGFSGDDCSQYPAPSQGPETCGGVVELHLTDIYQEITSPGYESSRFSSSYYPDFQECTWLIKLVDANGQIKFEFVDRFGLYCKHFSCYHWVEVRYKTDLTKIGPRYCCEDLDDYADCSQVSENGEMMVIFKSPYGPTDGRSRVGFKLRFYAVNYEKCPMNATCPDGEYCNPQTGDCDPCPDGFNGDGCREDIDECTLETHGCTNGATCVNTKGSYYCDCAPGFADVLCDQNINECDSDPCENGGRCEDEDAGYTCVCTDAYTGNKCETDINECASDPCKNGGKCEDEKAGYTCVCTDAYTGTNCETEIEPTTTTTEIPSTTTQPPSTTVTSTEVPSTTSIKSTSTEVPSTTSIKSTSTEVPSTTSIKSTSTSTQSSTESSTESMTTSTTTTVSTSTESTTKPTTTSTQSTSTTESSTQTTTSTSTSTTEQAEVCNKDGYWGENCECPDSTGGKGRPPGTYADPCCSQEEMECTTYSVINSRESCTGGWFGWSRCVTKYYTTRKTTCSCGIRGKCYKDYHLFLSSGRYFCGKIGFTGWVSDCFCCVINCEPNCGGFHVKKKYYNFRGDFNDPEKLEYYHDYPCFDCPPGSAHQP